jgi:hypothetical protein
MMEVTVTNGRHLILTAMASVIGISQALQDDVHHLQNIAGRAWVMGDLWDGRHAKVHQNLGDTPTRITRCLASATRSTSAS